MIVDPSWQMWLTFALVAAAVAVYASEWLSIELTSLGLLTTLLLVFHFAPLPRAGQENVLDAGRLLAGFADPALVAVVSLMIVGQGMIQTGALDAPMRHLAALRRHHPALAVVTAMGSVVLLSAFVNNTPVVVIFIPVITALATRLERPASSLMMPLSFAAILGGITTLIGSSTNLLVSGSLRTLQGEGLGFFDFTLPGVILALVGLSYVVLVMPRLLPDRRSFVQDTGDHGRQYIAQIAVRSDSPLVGRKLVAGMLPDMPQMTVRLILRGDQALLPPLEGVELRAGDLVVVAATRATLKDVIAGMPALFATGSSATDGGQVLAEVVVAPASRIVGRNLRQIGFRHATGCTVLGVQRRSRMIRSSMDEIRLEAGDVLLVVGNQQDVTALRSNRDVLLLEWSAHEIPALSLARRARVIFGAVVLAAASGLVPIVIAAVTGAAAMIATGCLNVHQASRAVDRRVVLLVVAALALGTALTETGGAAYLAHVLVTQLAPHGPLVTLSAFFLLVATLTNVLTNNATAVLFTPIAVETARQLAVDPFLFVIGVIFAANCSFATPMGYQTNLLVMAPGHYHFGDFVRAGGPLVLLMWAAFTAVAAYVYGL